MMEDLKLLRPYLNRSIGNGENTYLMKQPCCTDVSLALKPTLINYDSSSNNWEASLIQNGAWNMTALET